MDKTTTASTDGINGMTRTAAADVCITIYELDWHHPDTFCPFDEYVWDREVMELKMECTLSKKVPDLRSRNSR